MLLYKFLETMYLHLNLQQQSIAQCRPNTV